MALNSDKTVLVGMSGGVDSSGAAVILQNSGYNVIGITMEIWDGSFYVAGNGHNACYGPDEKEDIEIARNVCRKLNIPHHVFDLKNEYKTYVISYFKEEYLRGRTPNPCIICNHKLKFGFLLEKAAKAGLSFDFFATGHYARLEKHNNSFFLKKALDKYKDQSYFLMGLKKEQLRNLMFPLGAYRKNEIRDMARNAGLEVADKAESQDFIAGGDYSTLFADTNIETGEIVDETGKVLGIHKGIAHYTIGQRKGLGISSPKPLYVLRIDAQNNRIVLTDKAGMFSSGLIASDLNLFASNIIVEPTKVSAKIRQNHKETPAILYPIGKNEIKLIFEEPQLSVTPGQFVAFYDNDTVLGGGVIKEAC